MNAVAKFVGSLVLLLPASLGAVAVEYDLTIARQEVNSTGRSAQAMTLNGRIPGPTLHFTEGDHAVIQVHNRMDVETSIHWHGERVLVDWFRPAARRARHPVPQSLRQHGRSHH